MATHIDINLPSVKEFKRYVQELISNPTNWVDNYCDVLKRFLDDMPEEFPSNYSYSPKYIGNNAKIVFLCQRGSFRLIVERLPLIMKTGPRVHYDEFYNEHKHTYDGLIKDDTVPLFPKTLQTHAKKYVDSDFSYTTKIDTKGNVTVGGSISYTNMCV